MVSDQQVAALRFVLAVRRYFGVGWGRADVVRRGGASLPGLAGCGVLAIVSRAVAWANIWDNDF